jgi:hypothetical protein
MWALAGPPQQHATACDGVTPLATIHHKQFVSSTSAASTGSCASAQILPADSPDQPFHQAPDPSQRLAPSLLGLLIDSQGAQGPCGAPVAVPRRPAARQLFGAASPAEVDAWLMRAEKQQVRGGYGMGCSILSCRGTQVCGHGSRGGLLGDALVSSVDPTHFLRHLTCNSRAPGPLTQVLPRRTAGPAAPAPPSIPL